MCLTRPAEWLGNDQLVVGIADAARASVSGGAWVILGHTWPLPSTVDAKVLVYNCDVNEDQGRNILSTRETRRGSGMHGWLFQNHCTPNVVQGVPRQPRRKLHRSPLEERDETNTTPRHDKVRGTATTDS